MKAPTGVARAIAQAKVNLFLRVLAREQSGYHQLETVFCRLDLGDVVTVTLGGSERTLVCDGAAIPPGGLGAPAENLAFRAADAYLRAAGWDVGFRIEIDKRIPVGAGLGGGSADAGAVLRAIRSLHPKDAPPVPVADIVTALGSDVPFLARSDVLALAWGRGERMLVLPPLPRRQVLLLQPSFGVSTADAYGWLAADRADRPSAPAPSVMPLEALKSWYGIAELADNDFEAVVERRHPEIAALRAALEARGARLARMTGSGSTVFGVFDKAPDAREIERATGCRVLATHTAQRVVPVERLG